MTIEMLNRDCMDYMANCKDKAFQLAIVDPPYGLGSALTLGGTWAVKWHKKGSNWDVLPSKEYFNELFRITDNWIIFGANYFIEYLPNCRDFIAWHKPYMDGMHTMSNVELALTSFDTNAKFVSINKDSNARIHVTQKPVALYKWLLKNYAKPGDRIFDSHGGSFSSAIACHQMGFDFVGCELDTEYFNLAKERFEKQTRQAELFDCAPLYQQPTQSVLNL